jgi:hypothetical protein
MEWASTGNAGHEVAPSQRRGREVAPVGGEHDLPRRFDVATDYDAHHSVQRRKTPL